MMVPRTSARAANAKEKRHRRTGSRQSAQPGAVVHASGVVSTSPHQHGLLAVDCSLRYVSRAEGPVSCFVVIRSRGGRVKLRRYLCSRREEAQPMRVGLRVIRGPTSTDQSFEARMSTCSASFGSESRPQSDRQGQVAALCFGLPSGLAGDRRAAGDRGGACVCERQRRSCDTRRIARWGDTRRRFRAAQRPLAATGQHGYRFGSGEAA